MKFIDKAQRKILSQSLIDFAKIILAAFFAGEFFIKFSVIVRVAVVILFVVVFCIGIYSGKEEE